MSKVTQKRTHEDNRKIQNQTQEEENSSITYHTKARWGVKNGYFQYSIYNCIQYTRK